MWGSARRDSSPPVIRVRNLDTEQPPRPSPQVSMDSLLRLFRSDFFDAFMAITYLYRYRDSRGVHDYLCNELYNLADSDLETFMPQVCNLLVHHARDSPGLERFIMDKCADSMHMALQVYYFLQAAVEDKTSSSDRTAEHRVRLLRTRCETAAVNGSRRVMLRAASRAAATLIAADSPYLASPRHVPTSTLFPSCSAGQLTDLDLRRNSSVQQQPSVPHENSNHPEHPQQQVRRVAEDIVKLALTPVLGTSDAAAVVSSSSSSTLSGVESKQTNAASTSAANASKHKSSSVDPEDDYDPVTLLTMKQERYEYFNDSVSIAKQFVRLSLTTRETPQEQRQAHLVAGLQRINDLLLRRMAAKPGALISDDGPVPDAKYVASMGIRAALRSIHLPLTRANSHALRILRVHTDEVTILTSRTRAPYMVNIEVLPTNMLCADKLLFCEQRVASSHERYREINAKKALQSSESASMAKARANKENIERLGKALQYDTPTRPSHSRRGSQMTPAERQLATIRKAIYSDAFTDQPTIFGVVDALAELEDTDTAAYKARQAVILGVYGELWSWKEDRILLTSPFRELRGTKLMSFIVKAGDDLRQEQLAVQLISQFDKIFKEEGVDLYLRPFTVMSVSSEAGFVEVITDAVSVHALKKRTPNFVSLLDYFERAFGEMGSNTFRAAQRRFIRSMAAYSLVCYFLQIKDRHNGNIMIDARGHIVHIDFGFMLANSPGAIKFENVPFKLTEEYLQVICAMKNVQDHVESSKTEGYRYFQELFVLGLLAARKHYDKIITLVEIMSQGTTMPCMTGGHSVVDSLRGRFAAGVPEEQGISIALNLIEESRLSWRSAGYDRFQAYSNGYR